MKRQLFASYLLLLLGILMPSIPVFPHHHHEDGRICMKNDLHDHEEGTCGHGTHGCHHEQSCNETDCLTTHFFRQGRNPIPTIKAPETAEPYPAGFAATEAILLLQPHFHLPSRASHPYIEALHSMSPEHIGGLRAPPAGTR